MTLCVILGAAWVKWRAAKRLLEGWRSAWREWSLLGFPASSAQHAKGHLRAGVALQRHGLARNAAAVPNLSLLKPLDLAWNCPEKKKREQLI